MKKMCFGSFRTSIFLCFVLFIQQSAFGQLDCSLDDASDGFGVWTQQATTTDGNQAGQFIGSSDLGTSWALYANSGQTSEIFRDLSNPVEIGGTISIQMDNGGINPGGVVGISFRNSSFENLAEVYFSGGQANYTVDASGGPIDAGIGFTNSGLLVRLRLLSASEFEVTLSYLSNPGVSQTLSGTLNSPAGGQSLENIRLFNFNAGGGNDQFFNNLEVCTPPDCLPGFYNLNDVCTVCPAGSFCPGDGNAYPCAPGSFTAEEGQISCTECAAGRFAATSGATSCADCPAGKFSAVTGAVSCTDCPIGTSQSNTASTFCLPCAEGTFSNTTGSEVCTACDEGFDSNTGAAECFDCQLDFVNLQFPGGATICEGSSFTAFGQVFEAGLTDVLGDQVLEIEAQFGITASTDPNPNNWTEDSWSPATFNSSSPNGNSNNDEYKFDIENAVPGNYFYTFRYRRVGCDNWIIGGFPGGEWDGTNNVSGDLTVLEEIDLDGDGFSAIGSPCGTANDCDDSNENINPGQTEILFNGIDDDCNSATADFNSGIFESFVVVDGTFYNLMSSSGNPDFDGNDFGNVSCDGLILNGGENKVFKCNNGDILNGSLLYRVYAINSASGSFNSVDFSFIENFNITAECRDQIWQQTGASVDLSAGLPPGSYAVEVYTTADYTFTGGSGTHFSNNGGNNYTATFTIADSDSDGTSDCEDACPNDPNKITEGICGCGIGDSDTDMDGVEDCNDGCPNDPLLVTPPTWYVDADGDGFGSSSDAITSCQQPAGYVADNTDCDDSNEFINPEADEVCDGVDNDCNGTIDIDAVDAPTWYVDNDGDGFGSSSDIITSCQQPAGYAADNTDCNDSNASINPNADEICDGVDNDCDGTVDENAVDAPTWYVDSDGDGFGNPDNTLASCTQPAGYVADNTDCNDSNASINPNADEVCDGVDNDCDGTIDENAVDAPTWYVDSDGDGFGNPDNTLASCTQPAGYVADNTDCNDSNASINPNADEVCDGVDNDCDGTIDENAVDAPTWYVDSDGDGFGNPDNTLASCTQPAGYVADNTDCNDSNEFINPEADEICDGVDNDCDGTIDENAVDAPTWYFDNDGDGFGNPDNTLASCAQPEDYVADNTDCNDSNASINPNADEVCDGVDNDCDGTIDENAVDAPTWYVDSDGDGFGNPDNTLASCAQPEGYVADNTDCNDSNEFINPEADEICDGVDNDCDGTIDENAVDAPTWYFDNDGDGFGNPDNTLASCAQPAGYVADNTDCNDSNEFINPEADEICDGVDNDCDGTIDENAVDAPTWYFDNDGDGFGNPDNTLASCAQPEGYVADNTDCNDSNASINPNADEVCDGVDNNCNGLTDVSDPDYLDDIAPVISCPSNQTQSADNNCETILADYTNLATATDNCSDAVSIIQSPAAGTLVSLGTVTVTLTASDGLNSADCSFDVTVVDNSPPVITCPADVVVSNDPGICGAIASFDEITAIDNCDDLIITQVDGPNSGSIFPIGTTNVSYIVQDGAGLEAACSFNVTVQYDPQVSIDSPQDPQENENGILVSDGVVTVYYSQSSSFYSSLGVTDFAELNSTLTPECSNGETNIDYQWFYFSLAEDADGIPDPFDPNVWTSVSGATGSSYTVNASTSIDFHRAYLVAISNDNGTYDVASNYIEVVSIDTRCKNPNKVKICMVPNGNPDNSHEICVNINAVDALLENSPGSFLGPCKPEFKTSDDRLADVDVFPNPTSSILTIQYTPFVNQDARLEIHDSRGGLIKEISIAPTQAKSLSEVSLDMSEFANGIYLVRVIDKQGIQTRRVVLSK